MRRRDLLLSSGSLLALSGCLSQNQNSESNAVRSEESSPSPTGSVETSTKTNVEEPTVRDTPEPDLSISEIMNMGEWITLQDHAIRVTDLEIREKFTDTFGVGSPTGEFSFPADQYLLVTYLQVKNISQSSEILPWNGFGYLSGDQLIRHQGSFEHPDYDESVDLDWLKLSEEVNRLQSIDTDEIESGNVLDFWSGAVVDSSTSPSDVTVVYDQTLSTGEGAPPGDSVTAGWLIPTK